MTTTNSPNAPQKPKHPGGRPPKFKEPCRSVTMTLPLRVLDLLAAVDNDRATAVAKLATAALSPREGRPFKPIDFLKLPNGKKLILVADSPALRAIPWLDLVEVGPARHLICLHHGVPVEKLEVTLHDMIDARAPANPERAFLADLLAFLQIPRRTQSIDRGELLFITD